MAEKRETGQPAEEGGDQPSSVVVQGWWELLTQFQPEGICENVSSNEQQHIEGASEFL